MDGAMTASKRRYAAYMVGWEKVCGWSQEEVPCLPYSIALDAWVVSGWFNLRSRAAESGFIDASEAVALGVAV